MSYDYDLIVVGGGPGGYVAAIRSSQLGLKTTVIEKDQLGGVCLNIGCIPSKSLIHQAKIFSQADLLKKMGVTVDLDSFDYAKVHKVSRNAAQKLSKGVQFLLKKNKVDVVDGQASLVDPHTVKVGGDRRITGRFILLAVGSRPKEIPGFPFDEDRVLSSTGALMLTELPKSLLILGAGPIGVEFAYVFRSFGVEVHLVEMLDSILPLEDREASGVLVKQLSRMGVQVSVGTKASDLSRSKSGVSVSLEGKDGKVEKATADKILVAVGRSPNSEGLGCEAIGLELDRGFVPTGDYYQTSVSGVFAVGDVNGPPLLAHVASKEGEIAVEHMAGAHPSARLDPLSVPGAVYSEPQLASFGYTEKAAKERGIAYKAASFPYRGAGKSIAIGEPEGFVKILTDQETDEIIGAHVVGAEATELIHELLLARWAELLAEDIAGMTHAHPTLSEAVMEAARAVEGRAIHI